MAVTHKDRYLLSTDGTFLQRVQASLIAACVAISNEAYTPSFPGRHNFACTIIQNPTGLNGSQNWVQLFCNTVATDTTCIGDATQAGTVALTSGNLAAQAALVTDVHIDSAVSAEFNSFIRVPI